MALDGKVSNRQTVKKHYFFQEIRFYKIKSTVSIGKIDSKDQFNSIYLLKEQVHNLYVKEKIMKQH